MICFVTNQKVQGPLAAADPNAQRGMLLVGYDPELGEREEDFMGERGVALVRAAVGMPDLAVTILNARSWEMAARVAERFQHERIFLVGDAAHVMPPSGGFGANTGIADAFNLAWKLALVIQQKADPRLLTTYEIERIPVAQSTMEQAVARYSGVWTNQQRTSGQTAPILDYLTVALGYRYRSAAILSSREDYDLYEDPYHPTGCPGSHATHLILEKDGQQCSTCDLFGRHFVLLTGKDGAVWCEAAWQVSAQLGLEIDTYRIGQESDYLDLEDRFSETYGVTTSGAVLVRPDSFIAWRAEAISPSPQQVLEQALRQCLYCYPTSQV